MAIGQITISAADWLAARVTDRQALMTASSRIDDLAQLGASTAVVPTEDSGESQLDQHRQQHSLLAAQDSYRKVAARIKARLADRSPSNNQPATPEDAVRQKTGGAATLLEGMRDSSKLLATLIAADAVEIAQSPADKTTARADPVFAPFGFEQKKTSDTPDAPESADAKSAVDKAVEPEKPEGAWETAEARADAVAADAAFREGLWSDLFENADIRTDHIPFVED